MTPAFYWDLVGGLAPFEQTSQPRNAEQQRDADIMPPVLGFVRPDRHAEWREAWPWLDRLNVAAAF